MADVAAKSNSGVTAGERGALSESQPAGGGSMAALIAITQREMATLFYSPIAYLVGFIFLVLSGHFFMADTLVSGGEATLRPLFEGMAGVLVFALPLLTMRTIADEFALGSIETLMTAPVSDGVVVFGKFLGTLLFYVVLLVATVLQLVLLYNYADPVSSVVMSGYFGMLLLGALFISVGIFASSLTRYQLLAAAVAVTILVIFTFGVDYGAEYAAESWQRQACAYMNAFGHFSDFARGVIDSRSVIFMLSGTVFFLFLATKVMESRRWR
jgi:ABC-2 type transport system permease protein